MGGSEKGETMMGTTWHIRVDGHTFKATDTAEAARIFAAAMDAGFEPTAHEVVDYSPSIPLASLAIAPRDDHGEVPGVMF